MAESQPGGRPPWWLRHWLAVTVLLLIVLSAYALLAATVLPGWVVSLSESSADPNHRLDATASARGALLGVLAPVVVAIGAAAAFLNYRETAAQNRRTVELSRETLRITERGQLTERFTKAIEQLGDSRLDIRLGGIYALEQIAKESEELHRPVMELLTAFLREHSRQNEGLAKPKDTEVSTATQSDPASNDEAAPLRADFQAIATVLRRRDVSHDPGGFRLDLRGVALNRAEFAGAQLQKADFAFAQLEKANFAGAQLQEASFPGAQLQEASFWKAQLDKAVFLGAELQGAYFTDAQLQKAKFGLAKLVVAHFPGAQLNGADFLQAQPQGADFTDAQLQKANFTNAQLQGANFQRAQLQEASFPGAQLQEASFWKAQLDKAVFLGAELQGAYFTDAQLQKAMFDGADLEGARFRYGETEEGDALGLTPEQFDRALNVDRAILPKYLAMALESKRLRTDPPTDRAC